jgi:transcriptional regulator with GAF, ATPase, and Fis domain
MAGEQLRVLLALNRYLTEEHPLEDALQRVAAAALELVPSADHSTVRLLDDNGEQLVGSARAGLGTDAPPASFRPGAESVAGWVTETGHGTVVEDTEKDGRFEPSTTVEARSEVAVPMFAGGGVVGVLSAMSAEPDRFDDEDEALLALVANCTSPLLDRARMFRQNLKPHIAHAMASPLRLRLMAELVDVEERGLSLEELVLRTGRHKQDVQACFEPFLRWRVVEMEGDRFRIPPSLPREILVTIRREIDDHAEQLGRDRHVRHHLLGGMIGLDPKMQMVFELVRQVARIDVPVLIGGETGTGKELVARAIHDISPRRKGFFGAVNCATLKESLFESQVFGHVRGAFTGAVQDYVGLVERCHEGTLFLDEVGDLSLENQVKLLRFLQEGTFSRLGESVERQSDFRLIAATNRDLETMVQTGEFRDDLYYRLAVFPIRVPSLRERLGDLKYLVDGIMSVHGPRFHRGKSIPTITPKALRQLEKYHWPGNVRELENVILRALVMAGGGAIKPEHLPEVELLSDAPRDSTIPPDADAVEFTPLRSLEDVQRDHISRVLRKQQGNIKATAQVLGISRTTLYKKIRDLSIDAPV